MKTHEIKYNEKADEALRELYARNNAITTALKISAVEIELGGSFNYYAFGGEINDDMRLACLEYEYLQRIGKINLATA